MGVGMGLAAGIAAGAGSQHIVTVTLNTATATVLPSEEGVVARRNEIRRVRQARLFWQGLQYAWWNPNDMELALAVRAEVFG